MEVGHLACFRQGNLACLYEGLGPASVFLSVIRITLQSKFLFGYDEGWMGLARRVGCVQT